MLKNEIKVLGWAGLFAVAAMCSMIACGSDDPLEGDDADDDAPTADGGKKDSGGGKDSGAGKDSGTGRDSGPARDSGPVPADASSDASLDPDADAPEDAGIDGSLDAGPGAVRLTVTRAGAGTGTVTSAPAGISCGATCQADFALDTEVTLTATPSVGSTFTGWTGACTGTATCVVSLEESAAVTATFAAEVLVEHAVMLNEILVNPPNGNTKSEFVELRCTPGMALSSHYFVILDGDFINNAPATRGKILVSKRLSGNCGTNGLVLLQEDTQYGGVAGTTYLAGSFSNLEGGSQTYLLIDSAADLALPVGAFLDANADGIIDDAALRAKVGDSLSVDDGSAQDLDYSPAVLSAAFTIQGQARFPGTSTTSAANWYFGSVVGAPAAYGSKSPNFPAGGALTPGAANSGP